MNFLEESNESKIEITIEHFDIVSKYRDELCKFLTLEPPKHPGGQKKNAKGQSILFEIMRCNQWLKTNFKFFL